MPNLLSTLRQWAKNISPGGYWNSGYAGLLHLYLVYGRSNSDVSIGFRPVELMELVRDAEEAPGLRIERDVLVARVAELENNNFTEV